MMESKVARAVLQDTLEVKVGTEVYEVAPPTFSLSIRVSELASTLPNNVGQDDFSFTIQNARHARVIADIVATLILGEPKFKSKTYKKQFKQIVEDVVYMPELEIANIITGIYSANGHVQAFTMLITSLKGLNLLKPTRMTQSGQ